MKLSIFFIFYILVSTVDSYSASDNTLDSFNYSSVLKGFELTRDLDEYPDLNIFYQKYPHYSPPDILKADKSQKIPKFFIDSFKKINLFVFGKETVKLRSCKNCIGYADDLNKTVYLDFNYLRQVIDKLNRKRRHKFDKKLLINFTIAHEVAHIVNHLHFNKYAHSMNGLRHHKINTDYNHLEKFPERLNKLNYERSINLHAEVDFIALVIMRELGWDYPEGVRKLVREFHFTRDAFLPRKYILKRGHNLW